MPSPLQMAVKIATLTNKINITTGIAVKPLNDMKHTQEKLNCRYFN